MVGGTIIRKVGGTNLVECDSWQVYTDNFEAWAGEHSLFTADGGISYGTPQKIEVNIDNAYIPIIYIDKEKTLSDNSNKCEIKTNDKEQITLSEYIDEDKQKQTITEVSFKKIKELKVTFIVKKGNKNANDSDGGDIVAKFFDKDGKLKKKEYIKDIKYDNTFSIICDTSIHKIEFYAYDNDWFFNGGIENVFCGQVILKLWKSKIQQIWESVS